MAYQSSERKKISLVSLAASVLVLCCLFSSSETLQTHHKRDIVEAAEFEDSDATPVPDYDNATILDNDEVFMLDDFSKVVTAADNGFNMFLNNSRSTFVQALVNLSSYLPINIEYAITVGKDCDIIKTNRDFYRRVPLIIAAFFIVIGVIFGFFGYRLIKIVLFLIGFLVGFAIAYFIIIALAKDLTESWIPYVALASAAVVGIIAGLITICIYYIGIFLAGASVGFIVTWFILSLINVPFLRDHIYVPILIAIAAAIVVGIIALVVQKWLFIVGTAILGSFLVVWGLDYYLELGSMIYFLLLFAEHRSSMKPCWYSWTILAIFFILVLAGLIVQLCVTGRKYNHKKEMKGICCGLCSRKKKDTKDAPDGGAKYMKLKPMEK